MKDKILEIVRRCCERHMYHDGFGILDALEDISDELDEILPIGTAMIWRTKGTSVKGKLTDEDIAKIESCGFTYDRERNLMLKK